MGRRAPQIGERALGTAFVGLSAILVVSGLAIAALERNLGPPVHTARAMALCSSVVFALIGVTRRDQLGGWLASSFGRRVVAKAHALSTRLTLGLAIVATVLSCRSARPEHDLLPLVQTEHPSGLDTRLASGGLSLTYGTKKLDPSQYWPDTCVVAISDASDARTFEAQVGATQILSGNVLCPPIDATIDPSRHTVHLSWSDGGILGLGILSSTARVAWRFPGFEPTSPAVWACRLGRLVAPPRLWVGLAWVSVALGALAGLRARSLRQANLAALVETRSAHPIVFVQLLGLLALSAGAAPLVIALAAIAIT